MKHTVYIEVEVEVEIDFDVDPADPSVGILYPQVEINSHKVLPLGKLSLEVIRRYVEEELDHGALLDEVAEDYADGGYWG